MAKRFFELLRRGWRKPPHVIVRWMIRQTGAELDQHRAPGRARSLTRDRLLSLLGGQSLDSLWQRLTEAPFPFHTGPVAMDAYDELCPGDGAGILVAAEDAVNRRVDLLGSGPVDLPTPIPWHKDFKSGHSWPIVPFRRIDVLDLGRDSDIKVPWELSRLQWLIPVGQAYLLGGEERYAKAVRDVIEDWDKANPLAQGVNWACTMDVALRGIALVWLFRVFHASAAWRDEDFRIRFLKLLYLHCDFTARHLEWSDINGNHLATNAAGLVIMGLFLGGGGTDIGKPGQWATKGWRILSDELPQQVTPDGVDFEVSTAYHRLVTELFLLPALYRRAAGLDVPDNYSARLRKMAEFTAAYSRPDGSTPLWGDADDGRVLPFGGQVRNDHRYLMAIIGIAFEDSSLAAQASGHRGEVFWTLGPDAAETVPSRPVPSTSRDFPDGGVYIMRHDQNSGGDHVFIDCGPVGMAGRGGHGHNDCLSLEAVLDGVHLLTDCGTYLYSADPEWRNDFRSTGFHNTPIVGGEEQNRFVRPEYLWSLHNDAKPDVRLWSPGETTGENEDRFIGAHSGYRRLADPVTVVRGVLLDKTTHRLIISDHFEAAGEHRVRVPYHLPPGVEVVEEASGLWLLKARGGGEAGDRDRQFLLVSSGADWSTSLGDGWVSQSYGIKHPAKVLNFFRSGPLQPLTIALLPADGAPGDPVAWLRETIEVFPEADGDRY
ncbi:MAG: alginate lyase family protein [Alphaproteobacteria bacterium]|nr:alginate lyase family protein [Alphaproteobacteria bacterium]